MKTLIPMVALLLAWSGSALALDRDQVRAEIVDVMAGSDRMKVEITEAGDGIRTRVGREETYTVPDGTPIEYDLNGSIYRPFMLGTDIELSDLNRGDEVVLRFDLNNDRQALEIRNTRTSNVMMRDRAQKQGMATSSRRTLPETASVLPALGLAGLLFASGAAWVRFNRRK